VLLPWRSAVLALSGFDPGVGFVLAVPGTNCSTLVSATPVAAAQSQRRLYSRVMVVMIRRTGSFTHAGKNFRSRRSTDSTGGALIRSSTRTAKEANAELRHV